MIFSSISYLFFLPIVVAIYWLAPKAWRKIILLVASYVFYMSWLPVYGVLLFGLSLVNYVFGLLIEGIRKHAKALMVLAIVLNVGILCYYKYTNFLISAIVDALKTIGHLAPIAIPSPPLSPPALAIILPLGISFFVFEFIHYIVDVKKSGSAIRNPVDFFVFASFFPSQIAGPIKRYQDFITKLNNPEKLDREAVADGLTLITTGLFKKIALADNLAPIVAAGVDNISSLGSLDAFVLMAAFTLQVYFDFSGYCDMGIGSARLLGIRLPTNFNSPLVASRNMIEFWQRWHITLSTWLRDYVLMPLTGLRASKLRFHTATMITMTLCGLWHGASWHFVVWGMLQGLVIVVTREYQDVIRKNSLLRRIHAHPLSVPPAILGTLFLWILLQPFFFAPSLKAATDILTRAFSFGASGTLAADLAHSAFPAAFATYLVCTLVFVEMPSMPLPLLHSVRCFLSGTMARRLALCLCSFVAAICLSPAAVPNFMYFQF